MIGFCPISSGSKGNAAFLGSKKAKLLIDMGISYKELIYRLEKIDVLIDDIDAILITHEHNDHIDGLKTVLLKKNIPVFANSSSAKAIYHKIEMVPKYHIFTTDEIFSYKDIDILPFTICHDAEEPVGFIFYIDGLKIGYCADIGFAGSLVINNLKGCDILYIESNHDENLLLSSKRPDILKKRILGRQGHLSNKECGNLIKNVIHKDLKAVYLAHLSSDCNEKNKAYDNIKNILKGYNAELFIAHQEKISKPYLF